MSSDYPELEHPIMGPFLKALQIKSFLQQQQFAQEDRQHARDLYMERMQEHHRKRAMDDLHTVLDMHALGAVPLAPNDNPANDAAVDDEFGTAKDKYRQPVQAPMGTGTQGYRLPSVQDQTERAARVQELEKAAEYNKAYQTAFGKAQGETAGGGGGGNITFPAIGDPKNGGTAEQTLNFSKEHFPTAWKVANDAKDGKFLPGAGIQTDEQGNQVWKGIDAATNKPVVIPLGTGGRPTRQPVQSESSQNASAKLRAKARVNSEWGGEKIQQQEESYAGGLYQTIAQRDGIDWQTENKARGVVGYKPDGSELIDLEDPDVKEAQKRVSAAKIEARTTAKDVVKENLAQLEGQYTDEELSRLGGGSASGRPGVTVSPNIAASQQKMQTALEGYRKMTPAQRSEVKNGETPAQWFTRTFGVHPDTIK